MKQSLDDTIAAIATPVGQGGLGVIRISGKGSCSILRELLKLKGEAIESHKMSYGAIYDPIKGDVLDEIMFCLMAAPKSYTGEDVAEIYCHGSPAVLQRALGLAIESGARQAERGEFTKRAFLNGRIDLSQAEAVVALVSARTEKGAGLALAQLKGRLSKEAEQVRRELIDTLTVVESGIDFPDDVGDAQNGEAQNGLVQIRGRIEQLLAREGGSRVYQEGISAVIAGKPNVGKSSLLNAILGEDRVIVSSLPGTTRDTIVESISINGIPVRLVDSAGLREAGGVVERLGALRAEREIGESGLVLLVVDGSREMDRDDLVALKATDGKRRLIVINKSDLPGAVDIDRIREAAAGAGIYKTSAINGEGVRELVGGIGEAVLSWNGHSPENAIILNERHKGCLIKAREAIDRAIEGCRGGVDAECVAIDIREAAIGLGEISGELVSEEVINGIFEKFCIGK